MVDGDWHTYAAGPPSALRTVPRQDAGPMGHLTPTVSRVTGQWSPGGLRPVGRRGADGGATVRCS